jgi:hypothetical protein
MRHVIYIALVLICLLYTAGAVEYIDSLQNAAENYNKNLDKIPQDIKSLLKNEKVSIEISLNDGGLLKWGFVTKNYKIVSYGQGDLNNPTIEIHINESALNDLLQSKDTAKSYIQEEKDGGIKIEGKTIGSSLRLKTVPVDANDLESFLNLIKP